MKYLAWLGWLVALLLALALISEEVRGQENLAPYITNLEWFAMIHQTEVDNGRSVVWHTDAAATYRSTIEKLQGHGVTLPVNMYDKWLKGGYRE